MRVTLYATILIEGNVMNNCTKSNQNRLLLNAIITSKSIEVFSV